MATQPLRFAEPNLVLLVRHEQTGVDLDISLAWSGFENEALRAREEARFGRARAPMATPEVLVVFKAIAARPKDLEDAEALLALHPDIDVARVRTHVRQLAELAGDEKIVKGFEAVVARTRALPRRTAKRKPKKALGRQTGCARAGSASGRRTHPAATRRPTAALDRDLQQGRVADVSVTERRF